MIKGNVDVLVVVFSFVGQTHTDKPWHEDALDEW